MTVAELMRTKVRTIGAHATLADAIAAMLNAEVSALPVLDGGGKPVGIVTNRDILSATLQHADGEGERRGPDLMPVVDFMSPWPSAVQPDTPVDAAARQMSYLDLKRLFVVDGDALAGVISQTDIVDALATARFAPTG
jgi:CBS domain-containing protein